MESEGQTRGLTPHFGPSRPRRDDPPPWRPLADSSTRADPIASGTGLTLAVRDDTRCVRDCGRVAFL